LTGTDSALGERIDASSTAIDVRKISGPPTSVPLVRLLWVVQRRRMTGVLSLDGSRRARLHVRDGGLVDLAGAGRWSVGESGATATSLSEAIGIRIAQGVAAAEAMDSACHSVSELISPWITAEEGTVAFDAEAAISSSGFPLPRSLVWIGWQAFQQAVDFPTAEARWAGSMRGSVALIVDPSALGLGTEIDALGTRVLRLAARAPQVWQLVDTASQGQDDRRREVLYRLEWCERLGLIALEPLAQLQEPVSESSEEAPETYAGTVEAEAEVEVEAEGDPRLARLQQALIDLEAAPLLTRLELADAKRKPTRQDLSEAFRGVSSRYHPDRYVGARDEVKVLAERCFSLLNSTADELRSPESLAEAWRHIECLRAGAVYVEPRERVASQIALKKAELLFRNRRYLEALPLLEDSVAKDPTGWEAAHLLAYCGYLAGTLPGPKAITNLDALEPSNAADSSQVHLTAGRIWKLEGQDRRALARFSKALQCDPACHDAERELRLARRRAAAAGSEREGRRWFGNTGGEDG